MYQNYLGSCQSWAPIKNSREFLGHVSQRATWQLLHTSQYWTCRWVPRCLLGVIAAAGHAATAWDCCPLSGICCSIWPSAVVSPCPQQFLLCFPPGCHCHRYTEGSELPKLPSATWKNWGNDLAFFMCYTVKGVSKPQCLTEVLMKSTALLISYIITCPFLISFALTSPLCGT